MGRVAKWIDSLTDAERDRIIEHPDPTYDGGWWWSHERNCGCLVGCVIGIEHLGLPDRFIRAAEGSYDFGAEALVRFRELCVVGGRFPDLADRFTAPRMWCLVKARAAKANRVVIPAVAEEAAIA